LRNWVDATVAMTGFPVAALAAACPSPPRLRAFAPCPLTAAAARALRLDELVLYEGLATIPTSPPELARLYLLLGRRGQRAWKIELTLTSACPPDAPYRKVAASDHRRAGAVLGGLSLS
jgi:hypothetical protein